MDRDASSSRRMTPRNIRIGCAGWSLSRKDKASFPETGSHLERYAAVFNAAEINSSFHRPHRAETYARWAASVPADFRFSVKLPKEISHTLRLRACASPLKKFLGEIEGLGRRLGCLLIQLPPSFAYERAKVVPFLKLFRRRFQGHAVLEARHATFFEPAVESVFRDFAIGRVGSDPAISAVGATPGTTGKIRYFRLHGSPRMYYSSYDEAYLQDLSSSVLRRAGAMQTWCIFDNTAHGFAIPNALRLIEILREKSEA
jgi:uncharacterized protein YecE (DUF72 family)